MKVSAQPINVHACLSVQPEIEAVEGEKETELVWHGDKVSHVGHA